MTRKAGSIVLDRLRERILLGVYFGCWTADDRLPSVRAVAETEEVDRKTAAAAYRELAREGLVRVEPRSGVYLAPADLSPANGDPLGRLHLQWLESTLTTATELGLDADAANRLLKAVAAVKRRRIPVVDADTDHACLMADEIAERAAMECEGCGPADVPASSGPLRDAPFMVATPSMRGHFRSKPHLPIVLATLDPTLLKEVGRQGDERGVVLAVGTAGLARELQSAVDHGLLNGADGSIVVVHAGSSAQLEEARSEARPDAVVVLLPGVPEEVSNGDGEARRARHLLADTTFRDLRRQLARSALDHVNINRSNGA